MTKRVKNQALIKLMRQLHERKNEYNQLDLVNNREFFQGLQDEPETWKTLTFLEAKGYIKLAQNPVTHKLLQIQVTARGTTYFEDIAEQRREKRVSWIQYVVTTVIAILALLVAVASLVWQIYTWHYQLPSFLASLSEKTQSIEESQESAIIAPKSRLG